MSDYFEKEYVIHSFNCDENFQGTLASIVNFLQDIAIWHSEERGCGYQEMKEMGLAWILYKWKIRISQLPQFRDTLRIRTWSAGMEKLYAFRCFRIFNQRNECIGEALSTWIVLDLQKRRVVPVSSEILSKYINLEERVLQDEFTSNPLSIAKDLMAESAYTIRRHDLDYNLHVNNAKYVEIFMDSLPTSLIKKKADRYYDLEVTYKKECALGTPLACLCYDTENENGTTVIGIIKDPSVENNRHANTLFQYTIN